MNFVSLSMQELPGAAAGVKSLHEVGLIRYYTVRAREVEKATREWLTSKGFPNPQEVVLCEGLHDKLFKVIRTEKLNDREAQSVVLLIDDRCERLVRAAEEIVATRPRMRDAFRHLVLVAFGVADVATQFEPAVLSETGLKMMSLPSWEHIDAFKQHFHRGEERMLNEVSRVNAFRS